MQTQVRKLLNFVSYRSVHPTATLAKRLHEIYHTAFRPPQWSLEMVSTAEWDLLAGQVEVLTFDTRFALVKKVTEEREPVNIAMHRHFDEKLMLETFEYKHSGYSEVFKKDKSTLPPNIAIYTPTPMEAPDGPIIHVINAVGFAFDKKSQPDYQYFVKGKRIAELRNRLKHVFLLAFACAERKKLEIVVLSLIGGGAFSDEFPGGADLYVSKHYMPALADAIASLSPKTRPKKIGIMGNPDQETMEQARKACGKIACEKYGFIPEICKGPKASKTLFVNAWDPHSMVGNGNAADPSLDGFFGRNTAMAYLSFPSVNRNIKYVTLNADLSVQPEILPSSTTCNFSMVQYNLLYSSTTKKTSFWEKEMITKTQKAGSKDQVQPDNILWSKRLPRLTKNMMIDEKVPDILLLQETSPAMLAQIKKFMQISHYQECESRWGCCGRKNLKDGKKHKANQNEGYCYVCWNPEKCVLQNEVDYGYEDYVRFVGVHLKIQDKDVVICSTHLPADGEKNIQIGSQISTKLKSLSFPIIIGGDFNVKPNKGLQIFSSICPKNLSGTEITFFNGGEDYEDDENYKNWLEDAKYDYVVGSKSVICKDYSVNRPETSRWPNEKEGSDHTATRLKIQI